MADTALNPTDITYYNQPVIKKSPWSWDIPAYYYTGGAAGAAVALGAAGQVIDAARFRRMTEHTRWIGVGASLLSSYFLIHDLGRPSRFLYMLRVFRPTSPMSVGVYLLSVFASANGAAWMSKWGPSPIRKIGDAAGVLAGIAGVGMAGYTGVLVANTVVPIWYIPRRVIPLLFLASSATSAASLLETTSLSEPEHAAVRQFGLVGKVAEIACMELVELAAAKTPQVAKVLHEGFGATLWHLGKTLAFASAVLSLLPRRNRSTRIASAICGTGAALCVRFGIHYAGQRSADDPRATFHSQRGAH